jgi:glycosyltransferase involved in cell wall biosynthesis
MRTDIRRTLGAASDTTVIVLASRFERLKGHAALLEAVVTLDGEWMVWIAGDAQRPSEDALSTELHAFVTTRGLAHRVRFLGERRDVPEILRAADVLCQPNLAPESFGLAFVEALYAGIPVVTSDIGGAREIVTAECGILLPPGNVSALRDALQGLMQNPQRRRELGAAGPSRARSLCDPVEQIHRLEQALAPRAEQALA